MNGRPSTTVVIEVEPEKMIVRKHETREDGWWRMLIERPGDSGNLQWTDWSPPPT